ncbi:hypothetical protein JCM11251_007074 [Rhodosporidiobolus azoricus]
MRFSLAASVLLAIATFTGVVEAGHKKKVPVVRTLCPAGETACPILGSTTYGDALKHHFETKGQVSGVMAGKGGYECVNTMESLDSCGGCASTGEGTNCASLRGVKSSSCQQGACIVFSCQVGWRVSLKGDKCVRAKPVAGSTGVKNGTRTAAKMHLEGKKASHQPVAIPISA